MSLIHFSKANKGFLILFVLYAVFLILDIVTTLINSHLLPYIEVNPLYQMVGTLWPAILLNFVIAALLVYLYTARKSLPFHRYLIITIMVVTILVRIVAVHNALTWTQTEMSLEDVKKNYTDEVRAKATQQYMFITYLPLILCVLPYLFWRLDHNVQRKDS